MSVVDEIKGKLDIVEYIQRYTPLKKAGRTYKCNCVFHHERTPSMAVNQERQTFKCFGCGAGGDIFSFAQKINGWTFPEALEELAKLAGVELEQASPEQAAKRETLDRLRGLMTTIADYYHTTLYDSKNPQAAAALKYAHEKRGLSDETLRLFGIGFAPPGWHHALEHLTHLGYSEDDVIEAGVATRGEKGNAYDRFRNRLMIPIRDDRGRVIGFGARALAAEDNPKYLNSPQTPLFDKSKVLFGLDVAGRHIRDSETAVIVEGYMDAIQAHQAGFYNVIAQMGTAMTEAQLKMIAPRWAKRIVMALDADAAGQNATLRGLEVARETLQADYTGRLAVDIRILAIPDAKDPDDFLRESPDKWAGLVENAVPVADYVIGVETGALPPNASVQEREAVARRLLPILAASESDLYKKDNVQKLALRLKIGERDLLQWAQEQQQIAQARPPRPERGEPLTLPVPTKPVQVASAHEVELEKQCLRALLQQPELFYHMNRKLRELAESHPALAQGPLNELSVEDFSRTDYRVLMQVFTGALEQDTMEPLDFIRTQLESSLARELEAVLTDEAELLRLKLRYGRDDLSVIQKQVYRFAASTDNKVDFVQKALKLRLQRLQRERQELSFLQIDAQQSDDGTRQDTLDMLVEQSFLAKRIIEADLKRQASLSKQI